MLTRKYTTSWHGVCHVEINDATLASLGRCQSIQTRWPEAWTLSGGKQVTTRTAPKRAPGLPHTAREAPGTPKTKTSPHDVDGEASDRQRGGVQSLERAFAILEEVARNREGISLAELSKRVGLHAST